MKHSELKKEALKRKKVKIACKALEPDFSLLRDFLKA